MFEHRVTIVCSFLALLSFESWICFPGVGCGFRQGRPGRWRLPWHVDTISVSHHVRRHQYSFAGSSTSPPWNEAISAREKLDT